MKLSIIIVNYRSWGHVANALDALLPDLPGDWEIVIVDNASEQAEFDEFARRYPRAKCIANPVNSGFGFGCIIGVGASTGEQLLFMNPDVVASAGDIRLLMEEKDAGTPAGIIAPRQVGTDGRAQKVFDDFPGVLNQSKTLKYLARALGLARGPDPRREHTEAVDCDWVTGSVLLIDRADYDAIGGWSPDYWMYAEDADLCYRARAAGLIVRYTPRVTVLHIHGGSSRINARVKALTKLEVVISKHVYVSRCLRGPRRLLAHTMIVAVRVPALLLGALADVLTLRQVPLFRVRSLVLAGLAAHYRGVARTGSWLSPRALANQGPQP